MTNYDKWDQWKPDDELEKLDKAWESEEAKREFNKRSKDTIVDLGRAEMQAMQNAAALKSKIAVETLLNSHSNMSASERRRLAKAKKVYNFFIIKDQI